MLDKYLKSLSEDIENEDACGFAIDSFPTKANKRPLPVPYPNESVDLDTGFDIDAKRILMDFDQTIHKYSSGWVNGIIYDDPIPGSKQVIDQFRNDGYQVIIFTCRLSETTHGKDGVIKQRKMIEDWLKEHSIEVDGMTAEKLPAEIYIDDRAYCFDLWSKYKQGWDKEAIHEVRVKMEEDLKEY